MEELIVRIENLLSLTKGQKLNGKQEIVFGKFVFFPNKYELLSPNRETKRLSHKEAGILMMLIDKTNQTTERKEILLKLWGDDSYFNSRNLNVYITKLHEYLKADTTIQIAIGTKLKLPFSRGTRYQVQCTKPNQDTTSKLGIKM